MNKRILVDGSNAWYRAHCMATSRLLDNPGAAVVIMTYILRKICKEFGKKNVIICWDAGHGGRKKLDSQYKAKRIAVPGVWADLPYMKRMAACLGLKQAFHQGFEADDVIGSLSHEVGPVIIVSYDKDFYQLVNDDVVILRPERTSRGKEIPRQIITEYEVIEEFSCVPSKVVLVKAFTGDSSDNIPKLPIRFMPKFKKVFYEVISKSDTLDEFYSNMGYFDDKYREPIREFKDRAILNYKLVTINLDLNVEIEDHKLSAITFEKLCDELEIRRLRFADWETISDEAAPPPSPIQHSLF